MGVRSAGDLGRRFYGGLYTVLTPLCDVDDGGTNIQIRGSSFLKSFM
jgi:hypothetical protein